MKNGLLNICFGCKVYKDDVQGILGIVASDVSLIGGEDETISRPNLKCLRGRAQLALSGKYTPQVIILERTLACVPGPIGVAVGNAAAVHMYHTLRCHVGKIQIYIGCVYWFY